MIYAVKNSEGIEYLINGWDEAYELCDELNQYLMEDAMFFVELVRL